MLTVFRLQPLLTVAIHNINLGISNQLQFSTSVSLGVDNSATVTILDISLGVGLGVARGVARRHCSQVSQRWQPQHAAAATGAGGEATG